METLVRNDVFSNMPQNDYLHLYPESSKNYRENIVDFLGLKKDDVAKATGLPVASIRYDHRANKELTERLIEWAVLFNLVAEHFNADREKASLWFRSPNPLLGGTITPRDMIRLGRSRKLYKFIIQAKSGNV